MVRHTRAVQMGQAIAAGLQALAQLMQCGGGRWRRRPTGQQEEIAQQLPLELRQPIPQGLIAKGAALGLFDPGLQASKQLRFYRASPSWRE